MPCEESHLDKYPVPLIGWKPILLVTGYAVPAHEGEGKVAGSHRFAEREDSFIVANQQHLQCNRLLRGKSFSLFVGTQATSHSNLRNLNRLPEKEDFQHKQSKVTNHKTAVLETTPLENSPQSPLKRPFSKEDQPLDTSYSRSLIILFLRPDAPCAKGRSPPSQD